MFLDCSVLRSSSWTCYHSNRSVSLNLLGSKFILCKQDLIAALQAEVIQEVCHKNRISQIMILIFDHELVFVGSRHSHRQALGGDIKLPLPKTNFLKRTSLYRAISIWNRLSVSSRGIQNKYTFKRTVTQELLQMTL